MEELEAMFCTLCNECIGLDEELICGGLCWDCYQDEEYNYSK